MTPVLYHPQSSSYLAAEQLSLMTNFPFDVSSTRTGTFWKGLRAVNSADFKCSFFLRAINLSSYGIPAFLKNRYSARHGCDIKSWYSFNDMISFWQRRQKALKNNEHKNS